MTTDLSIYQNVLNRDPVLYLDMTETVRRGIGTILYASPTAALVGIISPDHPSVFGTCLMSCTDMDAARLLCGLLPARDNLLIAAHEEFYLPLLKERFNLDFFLGGPSFQAAYLDDTSYPAPSSTLIVRQLTVDDLPQVTANYKQEGEDYLRSLLERGQLFGGFQEDTMVGFVGRHEEGSIGLLEIFPSYRRRGFATELERYMINQELSLNHVPFGQVLTDNAPSLALQHSLGMTFSKEPLYWLSRT